MAASEQVEVELKFDVDAGHVAPDLRVLPGVVSATTPARPLRISSDMGITPS